MSTFLKSTAALALAVSIQGQAHAAIAIVDVLLTNSSITGDYFQNGNEIGTDVGQDGAQIEASFGDRNTSSAQRFESTSDLDGDVIFFKNGNVSFGREAFAQSTTVVDITVENTGTEAFTPILNSQIVPAGMGIYLSDCSAIDLRDCEASSGDVNLETLDGNVDPVFINAGFEFTVLGNGKILYSINGGVTVRYNALTGRNEITTQLDNIFDDGNDNVTSESRLNNFRLTSPVESLSEITFDWGATDFTVEFPDLLDIGETGTFSYITQVTTSIEASCSNAIDAPACAIAYAAFGDPIGRGGAAGTRPPRFLNTAASGGGINGIEVGAYAFNIPTFNSNGTIDYQAVSGPGIVTPSVSVPTPASIGFLALCLAAIVVRLNRRP